MAYTGKNNVPLFAPNPYQKPARSLLFTVSGWSANQLTYLLVSLTEAARRAPRYQSVCCISTRDYARHRPSCGRFSPTAKCCGYIEGHYSVWACLFSFLPPLRNTPRRSNKISPQAFMGGIITSLELCVKYSYSRAKRNGLLNYIFHCDNGLPISNIYRRYPKSVSHSTHRQTLQRSNTPVKFARFSRPSTCAFH